MPDAPRLYTDLAHLWPHLSPPEHYTEESATLIELIDDALGDPPAGEKWSLLELGAGGGHSIVHLKDKYDCTASDLSPQMLRYCKQLNPAVPAVTDDMRTMRLEQSFDIVLICDAIDYMLSEDDAVAALTTAAAHLKPNGILLFAPTYTRETFVDGDVADDGTTVPGIAGDEDLTYFSFVHDPDPADSTFEMILLYLVRDAQTRQVQTIEDRHTCGLFSIEAWQQMAASAGLQAQALAERAGGGDGDADADAGAGEALSAWSVVFGATHAVQ